MSWHHVQHMQNMGPSLFVCRENSAYVITCVTACAVMSCAHFAAHACRQASSPYENVACQKKYLVKLTASHFSTLNTRIVSQNVLKMICIAMHNDNKADCNENFRICAEESVGPLYKW